jgi:hypothetical protein
LHAQEAAGRDSVPDRAFGKTGRGELAPVHDAVLALGELADARIRMSVVAVAVPVPVPPRWGAFLLLYD